MTSSTSTCRSAEPPSSLGPRKHRIVWTLPARVWTSPFFRAICSSRRRRVNSCDEDGFRLWNSILAGVPGSQALSSLYTNIPPKKNEGRKKDRASIRINGSPLHDTERECIRILHTSLTYL